MDIRIATIFILLPAVLTVEVARFNVNVGGQAIPAVVMVDDEHGLVEATGVGSGRDKLMGIYLDYNSSKMIFKDNRAHICYVSEFVPYMVSKIRQMAIDAKTKDTLPLQLKAYKFIITPREEDEFANSYILRTCNGYRLKFTELSDINDLTIQDLRKRARFEFAINLLGIIKFKASWGQAAANVQEASITNEAYAYSKY